MCAKSDCGLPANNKATPQCITREEEELRWRYAYSTMTFDEYKRQMKALKKKGLAK